MGYILAILIWGVFGYLVGRAAQEKGRDFTLWFILGVVGNVIAMIAILFMPRSLSQEEKIIKFAEEHKQCHVCGAVLKNEARACNQCGHMFGA